MAERGRGGIVLLSSLTAFWGSPWVATYGATKAFNLSLGEALAHELGERGVDVLVSCAGATRTPGFVSLVAGRKAPQAMRPEVVAEQTLNALPKRGVFVPGARNRFIQLLLSRLLPRTTAVRIMAGQTRALLGRASSLDIERRGVDVLASGGPWRRRLNQSAAAPNRAASAARPTP